MASGLSLHCLQGLAVAERSVRFFFFFFFLETKIFIFYIPVTNIFHDQGNHESFSSSFTQFFHSTYFTFEVCTTQLFCSPDSLESVNMYTNVKVFIFCKQCTVLAVTHTFSKNI